MILQASEPERARERKGVVPVPKVASWSTIRFLNGTGVFLTAGVEDEDEDDVEEEEEEEEAIVAEPGAMHERASGYDTIALPSNEADGYRHGIARVSLETDGLRADGERVMLDDGRAGSGAGVL